MSTLDASRFAEYFRALHGPDPFPWQRRLARQVIDGAWPDVLALPTASGKTSCIDIAVFALACQAERAPHERTAARRIFFVVDRRLIVDEAFQRANILRERLQAAREGVLFEVAQRLRALAGHDERAPGAHGNAEAAPLVCFQLRGGIYRDDSWVQSPTQPAIIASTVDQVGSRLLFRGYGLRKGHVNAIHAGLSANDSLILLDEAHCARPFMETAAAVRRYRGCAERSLGGNFDLVVMSATPPTDLPGRACGDGPVVFRLEDDDRAHDTLGRRLRATKPARLHVATKARGGDAGDKLATEIVRLARDMGKTAGIQRVGIIVNRVAVARAAYEQLRSQVGARVVLLVGRMRPIDRDELLSSWRPDETAEQRGLYEWFGAGKQRIASDEPVFVVATQCLEVGANLDFDALITECASLDALRQRFGRLDRLGTGTAAQGIIVIRGDQVAPKDADPIYGDSLPATWAWMDANASNGVIDMGIDALNRLVDNLSPADRERLQAPAPRAPVMLPAHLDLWVQTSPVPCPDPDVAVFLHGPEHGAPEVQVCWRADLDDAGDQAGAWIETVSLCPPGSRECMPVPLHAVRAWLAEGAIDPRLDVGDVESAVHVPEETPAQPSGRRVLRWLGPEDSELVPAGEAWKIRPGDTIVIPAMLGGWRYFGHLPEMQQFDAPDAAMDDTASGDVLVSRVDAGDRVHLESRRVAVLRLHPALVQGWPASQARDALLELCRSEDLAAQLGEHDMRETLRAHLDMLAESADKPSWLRDAAEILARDRRFTMHSYPGDVGLVLRGSRRMGKPSEGHLTFTDEDHTSSATVPVSLSMHNEDVERCSQRFAESTGLPAALVRDVALAGSLHDLGKADRRFQALLHNGDAIAARMSPAPLAKSGRMPQDFRAYALIQERSGYPRGARHELVSVRLVESAPALLSAAHDPELVLHLIASHHGRCRPFAPHVPEPEPVEVEIEHRGHRLRASSDTGLARADSGVAERFWRLTRRYGWWGLAWLEACLRLGDWRASAEEQQQHERKSKVEEDAA
jgi:CRISPR-associated endonuclease/helicase Cas3